MEFISDMIPSFGLEIACSLSSGMLNQSPLFSQCLLVPIGWAPVVLHLGLDVASVLALTRSPYPREEQG